MKLIGLLGGTSWPSTPLFYEHLNRMASERLGGFHSARIVLYSVDYHPLKSRYNAPQGWEEIPNILHGEIERLSTMRPDCILICNNTLHKAIDILDEKGRLPTDIPIIHMADAVGQEAIAKDHKKLLLLATRFTMEDGFYAKRLEKKFGLNVSVPNQEDRNIIQEMQSEIAAGRMKENFRDRFKDLLTKYTSFDAIVPACTELPMVISQESTTIPVIDPIYEQCTQAVNFALK